MSQRFACPTAALDLEGLLRRARRALWVALGLAAALHLLTVGANPFEQVAEGAARPLTTRFVKRMPRLTKPLELRKVPRPQRQLIPRQVQPARARLDQVRSTAAFHTSHVLGLASQVPAPPPGTSLPARALLEPGLQARGIAGTRSPASTFDLSLEMLDIEDMDTGRYQAMVIQDRADPQGIKGFVKIARVFSEHNKNDPWHQVLTLQELVDALNEYTGIRAEFVGHVAFDEPRLLEIPVLVYWGADQLTEHEQRNLVEYLMAGGFIIGRTDWKEALERYGGLIEGQEFYVDRLPDDHGLYHSYFDILGMPTGQGGGTPKAHMERRNYVDGLWINGRLAAVDRITLFLMGLGNQVGYDATRLLQFGVNIMVYALTEEGSLTQRSMKLVE